MKMLSPVVLGLSLAVAGSMLTAAQETSSKFKVLQIVREETKPCKGGAAHDKTESDFVQAVTKAEFPAHYVAMTAMSGRSRTLYLTIFDSFAEWEKDEQIVEKNPALAAELSRATASDAELLDQAESAIFTTIPEMSYKSRSDLTHARYVEMSVVHLRAGHRDEWNKLAKMAKDGHEKAGTSAHWTMYEVAYGPNDGTYMILSADNSMADIDTEFADNKKFMDALGSEGAREFRALSASAIDTSYSQLFAINPKQSYPMDEWVKGDPDFWKPKPATATKPATAAKPDAAKKP